MHSILFAMLFVGGSVGIEPQVPPQPAAAAAATVLVTGMVVDAHEQPLYGAVIILQAADGTHYQTTSSRSGRYETRVPPGKYPARVQFTHDPNGLFRFERPAVQDLVIEVKAAGPVEVPRVMLALSQRLFALARDAQVALSGRDKARGIALYEELLTAAPQLTGIHRLLAAGHLQLFFPAKRGEPDNDAHLAKAIEHMQRAADTAVDEAARSEALTLLARTYEDPKAANDLVTAEDIMRRLVAVDQQRADHHVWLARLQERLGRTDDAEYTLKSAADMLSDPAKVYQELVAFYMRTKQLNKIQALPQDRLPAGVAPPSDSTSPPRVPPRPGAVRVGGNIRAPQKLHSVDPVYPPEAAAARIAGVVILEVQIDQQGNVSDAGVLRSIPMLDAAAVDCVKQWKYDVTYVNGTPVAVIMTVTVNFALQ